MKAQLKHTNVVEIDCPTYFSYSSYFCQILNEEQIIEVSSTGIHVYFKDTILAQLARVEQEDFKPITKEEFAEQVGKFLTNINIAC